MKLLYLTSFFFNGKKSLVIALLCGLFFFNINFVKAQTCDFTIELFDSFGDGWNGSILNVSVAGVATDYTVDATQNNGDFAIYTISANINDAVVFTYSPGAFEGEVTYNILDPDGVIIFSDGPNPATGVVFSTFACPTCPGPTTFNIDDINSTFADVSWENVDSVLSYNVEFGLAGFAPGTGTMTNVTTNSTSFSGLTQNTMYEFYVQFLCANGDSSGLAGPFPFTTTFENPCNYTIQLYDSFGDGWNGSILNVSVGGISTDYTLSFDQNDGDSVFYTISAGSNIPLTFTYSPGAFEKWQYHIFRWTISSNGGNI